MKTSKTTHINTNISSNTNNSNLDYNHHLETLDNSDLLYLGYLRNKQIKRNKWIKY